MQDKSIFLDGKKIKDRRILLKMSQSDLAKNITTQATISLMENQNRVPNIIILLKILSRLNLGFTDIGSNNSDEQEIEALFTRHLIHGEIKNPVSFQFEQQKIKSGNKTDFYEHIIRALDHFYDKDPDYYKALENLKLAAQEPQFKSISKLNQYVIYQYLALCQNGLGCVKAARNYFDEMLANEPNTSVISDEQCRCILKVRSNYIDFLVENGEYQLSEYYIKESLVLCKHRYTIYLVSNFYRQWANIQKNTGKNDLFLKYMFRADNVDTFLAL